MSDYTWETAIGLLGIGLSILGMIEILAGDPATAVTHIFLGLLVVRGMRS